MGHWVGGDAPSEQEDAGLASPRPGIMITPRSLSHCRTDGSRAADGPTLHARRLLLLEYGTRTCQNQPGSAWTQRPGWGRHRCFCQAGLKPRPASGLRWPALEFSGSLTGRTLWIVSLYFPPAMVPVPVPSRTEQSAA